jgi:hypothetical protein
MGPARLPGHHYPDEKKQGRKKMPDDYRPQSGIRPAHKPPGRQQYQVGITPRSNQPIEGIERTPYENIE